MKFFASFALQNGGGLEFEVGGKEYGMLAEGDEGKLTFQGTRFVSFKTMKI